MTYTQITMSFTGILVYPCSYTSIQKPGNGTGLDIHSPMKWMDNEIVGHIQGSFIQSYARKFIGQKNSTQGEVTQAHKDKFHMTFLINGW